MRNITINLSYNSFTKLIATPKVELNNNFIYEGVLRLFNNGSALRSISGLIMQNKIFDNLIINVDDLTDEENISLSYTFNEIGEAFAKTKYKIGVSSPNKALFTRYFSYNSKSEKNQKNVAVKDNLKWIKELNEKINPDLLHYLENLVPSEIDNLKLDNFEKLLYLYFSMCQFFSYSEDFFVNREANEFYRKDYQNISNLSINNRNVVCYEFNVIFALLAEKYGFKTIICDFNENPLVGMQIDDILDLDEYKNQHYSVIMDNGDYRILFDSTRGSLDIDLFNVKVGRNVNGIKNINMEKNNIFQFKVDKIYNLFLEQNNIKKSEDYVPVIDVEKQCYNVYKVLEQIEDGNVYLDKINIKEKIEIFKYLPLTSSLKGMDLVSYLYVYFKKIFKNDSDVHFRIIRTNEKNTLEQKPIVVLSYVVNKERHNFFFDVDEGFYYVDNESIIEDYYSGRYDVVDNDYNLGEFSRRGK